MTKFRCCKKSEVILCEKCNKFSCIDCNYILDIHDVQNLDNVDYQVVITVSCCICDKNK